LGRRPLFKNMRRSFRTPGDVVTVPRALPWAGKRCLFGTPGADPVLPITATPSPTSSSLVRSFRVPVPDFAKALGATPRTTTVRRSAVLTKRGSGLSMPGEEPF
jgi:hypothetical protein